MEVFNVLQWQIQNRSCLTGSRKTLLNLVKLKLNLKFGKLAHPASL